MALAKAVAEAFAVTVAWAVAVAGIGWLGASVRSGTFWGWRVGAVERGLADSFAVLHASSDT